MVQNWDSKGYNKDGKEWIGVMPQILLYSNARHPNAHAQLCPNYGLASTVYFPALGLR
jgi:hypothetical protein